ncbi:putative deoxynucleoside-5'-monophosphate kinase [Pectobacterium phage DU_PP_V]|uniref:Putative deoxynucleoside-5'-monophosphate kinase n=1 Tax=Pectobacterium phage DU_PP_V TaxID=2041492 RepID=A0A2D2W6U2_9CAUD|nr:putative deoxynucleoside-5'-monophosphate kinase [Pectobacterium phage DU_PP_V]ATS94015.1 putative deoxynucleoside-5'-monophosphate kinase [Pectobacterium phage DU_PP_V]
MNKTVIGLTGKARSGKDTAAALISELLPNVETFSFAEPVYNLTSTLISSPVDYISADAIKDLPNWYTITQDSIRKMHLLYQKYGIDTKEEDFAYVFGEFFQKYLLPLGNYCVFNKDVWEFSMFTSPRIVLQLIGTEFGRMMISETIWTDILKSKVLSSSAETCIITDVRFDNEAELVLSELPNSSVIRISLPNNTTSISESSHKSEGGIRDSLISVDIINRKEGLEPFKKTLADVVFDMKA